MTESEARTNRGRGNAPRVLVVLDTGAGWSRGILLGFAGVAHERGWELLHYHPSSDLSWLADEWAPAAAVLGPEPSPAALARFSSCPIVSVNADRSAECIASVCLDEEKIATLALRHLISRGFEQVAAFRFEDSPFAAARERAFRAAAAEAGARFASSWWVDGASPLRENEDRGALVAWLRGLPRPCGIFTCCDRWGRVVARYARVAGLRIPEDLALVGVDNDAVECELITPPLSSVAVPWRALGQEAASLVRLALAGKSIAGKRLVVSPVDVVARRSSDTLAVDDALVARAVAWIRMHAAGRVTVPMVARAVSSSRQRLERRCRASLGRTVQEEVRRVRVEAAKRVLATTTAGLAEIARQSGFTSAALLSVAFQRELGMPPGVYRRRILGALVGPDDS